jgi:hypothetical protein
MQCCQCIGRVICSIIPVDDIDVHDAGERIAAALVHPRAARALAPHGLPMLELVRASLADLVKGPKPKNNR